MTEELKELLGKLDGIRNEIDTQIQFLREDTNRVDMTKLLDQIEKLEEIMLNPGLFAEKNYPQLISNFLTDRPLTVETLVELDNITKEFIHFLKC